MVSLEHYVQNMYVYQDVASPDLLYLQGVGTNSKHEYIIRKSAIQFIHTEELDDTEKALDIDGLRPWYQVKIVASNWTDRIYMPLLSYNKMIMSIGNK